MIHLRSVATREKDTTGRRHFGRPLSVDWARQALYARHPIFLRNDTNLHYESDTLLRSNPDQRHTDR